MKTPPIDVISLKTQHYTSMEKLTMKALDREERWQDSITQAELLQKAFEEEFTEAPKQQKPEILGDCPKILAARIRREAIRNLSRGM